MKRTPKVPDDFPQTLFRAVECQRFGAATCFLCGRRLGTRNRTDEHIFPKWLLHRFQLWDASLVLLNGTDIPYRQLTIPCCRDCNGVHLAALESRIEAAVGAGPAAVAALPASDVAVWLGKIVYGILYKEGFLRLKRSLRRSRRILSRDMLEAFSMHHYFLQSVRVPMKFTPDYPGSVFVFEVQEPDSMPFQYDFRDEAPSLAVSIRMGRVGILAALQDGGAQRGYSDHLSRYQSHALHPLQFLELSAQFLYKVKLQVRVPKFIMMDAGAHIEVLQLPLGGMSLAPIFAPWSHEHFAHILAFHTGFPVERLYHPSNRVISWLNDGLGKVPQFSLTDHPWPAPVLSDQIDARRMAVPDDSGGAA